MADLNPKKNSEPDGDKTEMILDGKELLLDEVCSFVFGYREGSLVRVSDKVEDAVLKSRRFLEEEMSRRVIYGVNTGFGPMASYIIGDDKLFELQENLVKSHAVGMGDPVRSEYVLAAMIIRLNTLAKGYAGVSVDLIRYFEKFINSGAVPIVPEHGAVGTSGDLVQLAHIALALIGEGEVTYNGKHEKAADVFKRLGINEYRLQPKEGLALINGTSVMTGISAVLCRETEQLMALAIKNGAFALELVHGFNDAISEKLHDLRPHAGQVAVAKILRDLLRSSKLLRDRQQFQEKFEVNHTAYQIPEEVQQVYSI